MPTARAFVPGHLTAFFGAYPDPDPRVAGSRGAGLTLARGVGTTVTTDAALTDAERAVQDGDLRGV